MLVFAGLQQFTEDPHGWALALAIVEILVGLLMLGALGRTAYVSRHLLKPSTPASHHGSHAHPEVEWENFVAAAMVLAEGWEHRMHGGHHFPRPAILTAAVLIVTGLLHGRILRAAQRRRTLRVSDEGIYVPGRRFKAKKIDARWADVASIEIGERWAVVKTRSGRQRRLDLPDLDTEAAVRGALAAARERLAAAVERPDMAE